MVKNSHQLSAAKDKWFLDQHRVDEYLQGEFHPGDTVVVCAKCHRVWFTDTWELQNCCPNIGCRHTETEPFGKKQIRIQAGSASRIKIVKNANSGYSGAYKTVEEISDKLEMADRIFLNWIKMIVTCIFWITITVFLGVNLWQYRNGSNAFPDLVTTVRSTAEDSVDRTEELVVKARQSITESVPVFMDSARDTLEKMMLSAEDGIKRGFVFVGETVGRQITILREMIGEVTG